MILFYSDEREGNKAFLTDGEAIHCRQALRKNVGDIVTFTDGNGHAYEGKIAEVGKKRIAIDILKEVHLGRTKDFRIHIAIAPTKNISRFEWFLEKATELGIDEITPILCTRSERKVIKEDRLKKILVSAAKQSLKVNFPLLNPMVKFKDFITTAEDKNLFIAHLEDDPKLLTHLYKARSEALILIGPEGDFTTEEIKIATDQGFHSVSLGDYRLRTETAAISAVQAIHFVNQL